MVSNLHHRSSVFHLQLEIPPLSPSPPPLSSCPSKSRSMNHLVVNHQLPSSIVDHHGSDTASAIGEGTLDLAVQPTLINDSQALLDISRLGHAHDPAVIVQIEDAVLLEDGAEHALNDHTGLGIADEGALLLQLTREEVDTQVAVLAGLGRSRDADDLARTALKDQEISDADEMAGNGDMVAVMSTSARLDEANVLARTLTDAARAPLPIVFFNDHLLTVVMMVMMMEGMEDTVGGTLDAAPEGVVLALVVVVAHVVAAGLVDGDFFPFDFDVLGRPATFVLDVVGRVGAPAVVALGYVQLGFSSPVSSLASIDFDVDIFVSSGAATINVDVDSGVFITFSRSSIPESPVRTNSVKRRVELGNWTTRPITGELVRP